MKEYQDHFLNFPRSLSVQIVGELLEGTVGGISYWICGKNPQGVLGGFSKKILAILLEIFIVDFL